MNVYRLIIFILLLSSCKTGVKVHLKIDDFTIYSKLLNTHEIKSHEAFYMEQKNIIDGQKTIVAGKLRLVGSSRNRKLVITTFTDFDIQILFKTAPVAKYVLSLQNKLIEIEGIAEVKKMYAPNGSFIHNKYTIVVDSLCIMNPVEKMLF